MYAWTDGLQCYIGALIRVGYVTHIAVLSPHAGCCLLYPCCCCCCCCRQSTTQENASNPQEGWRAKDCAVYLVMAVTVKGRTGERGATTTNRLVNVGDFFTQQVCVWVCVWGGGGGGAGGCYGQGAHRGAGRDHHQPAGECWGLFHAGV
jgi:hypothetical protein